ncbi:MAG: GNAT family N-acetyltransferase [Caulobacter sp. 12-67-6]|nr:MAG: GNAT family N-acetyltransferase [Caulobacter sp. 12-67-6]OYX70257.1 MAG: GNAT family N-acetyltransferase [Caulobacter sp. 32-67-35]OZA71994.1 MAG: GNAT family N-acetyltransferase [Caulobacter sp. 39-67-4]HQR88301.1 N-acetyltransferase [Caulobacter sp.]
MTSISPVLHSTVSAPALVLETPAMETAVTALIDRVFGPGRFAKVSERLREGNHLLGDCSFVAMRGGQPVGCVRLWPVTIGGAPVAFLGPLAVDPDERSAGLGQTLVEAACEAARAAGWKAVMLVGDAPYFARAGFSASQTAGVVMPGPVDQRRVLVKALVPGGDEGLSGLVSVA